MYPYDLFLDITLYDLLLAAGIIVCLLMFRKYADKIGFGAELQNLVLICAVVAVIIGYGGAVLTQSIYSFIETGEFKLTGATFYGGLIGGAGAFLLCYFIAGHFLFKNTPTPFYNQRKFFRMADIAACSITVAHGIGRLGCLCAGCCYGKVFEESHWYTFTFKIISTTNKDIREFYALPVQLYEAVFLLALCAYLSWRMLKHKSYGLQIYMIVYGIWRFLIEYVRDDDRGQTVVSFLSPSQLIAILMIAGGIALIFIERRYASRHTDVLTDEAPAAPAKQSSDNSQNPENKQNEQN